jgi:hypothetical protein
LDLLGLFGYHPISRSHSIQQSPRVRIGTADAHHSKFDALAFFWGDHAASHGFASKNA